MSPICEIGLISNWLWSGYLIPAISVLVTIFKPLPIVPLVQGAISHAGLVVGRGIAVLAKVRIVPVTPPPAVVPAFFLAGVIPGVQSCLPQFIRATELAVAVPVASPPIVVIVIPISISISIAIAIVAAWWV